MSRLSESALDVFEAQHGVASRSQLLDHGSTPHDVLRLQRSGLLVPVLRGVYRMRGQVWSHEGRCAAVCLAHPDAVVAGPTAGRLWGLRRMPRDRRVHVISSPASNPAIARWVVPYRTAAIRAEDRIERGDAVVVTSRARTALDLARWLRDDDLLSVIEQAIHDGPDEAVDLWDVASRWVSPHRPWLKRFLDLLAHRLDGGAAESHPEVIVGERLRRAGIPGLVRQFSVELPEYGRVRFDLAIPKRKWAIEVDGFPTHRETVGRRKDRRRDRAAARDGWVVTRLGPDHLGPSIDATIDDLVAMYREARAA